MSRGYNNLNRTFVAKEPGFGPIPPEAENGSHWHRLDVLRLRFHPAFRLPQDGPKGVPIETSPSFVPLEGNQFQINAPAGLSILEMNVDGHYRTHLEFLQEHPKTLVLSMDEICSRCKCDKHQKISLEAMCVNQQQRTMEDVQGFIQSHAGVRLPGVPGHVIQSDVFGGDTPGATQSRSIFLKDGHLKQVVSITVHHGSFLDGFVIHWNDGTQDVVGKTGGGKSRFIVMPGEQIQGIILRCGAWIDGLQFKLSSGRLSPWYGGMGGSPTVVEAPEGYDTVGFFSTANDWTEQIGIFYRRCIKN
ncbi:Jacalin-like lectin domain-containing protein [Mucor mucedo]|uniref:Jacalin-like lectin domain-containing protein n=1 Tax=Mucor mucedo TaxID=29922 RepID=UPI00221FC575|nr:Jacalin-like lectin domain-containing protein [Mucor mucedo]KAI7892518.1 Jacalin-like lectin domain-containing protein [Mucor mucedo]